MKRLRIWWVTGPFGLMRKIGPYGAIELLLPGGSLIVLSLWAVRHRSWLVARMRSTLALVATVAAGLLAPQLTFADSPETSGSQPSVPTVPVAQRDCDAPGIKEARKLADLKRASPKANGSRDLISGVAPVGCVAGE